MVYLHTNKINSGASTLDFDSAALFRAALTTEAGKPTNAAPPPAPGCPLRIVLSGLPLEDFSCFCCFGESTGDRAAASGSEVLGCLRCLAKGGALAREERVKDDEPCLLYTSPSPRDRG